jgi:hypothetical protein
MKEEDIPNELIIMIKEMLSNRHTQFITPVGISDSIRISRGVPQGDIISPILFNIFFNKLLKEIRKTNIGYNVKGEIIPLIAYADDLIIISNNRREIKVLLQAINSFCLNNYFNLNVNKCMYTTNNIPKAINWNNNDGNKIPIPICKGNQTDKYLGLLISLDLNWNDQMNSIRRNLNLNLTKIKENRFTFTQRISIINKLIIPYMRYSMSFVKYRKEFLEELDKQLIFN